MASATSTSITTMDHEPHEASPHEQLILESLIRVTGQWSEEVAYKGLAAILKQSDALRDEKENLEKELEAADQTIQRIVNQIQAAENDRNITQDSLDLVEKERDDGVAKLKEARDQVKRLTTEITATNEEITKAMRSKKEIEQQRDTKVQENDAQAAELKKRGDLLKETREKLEKLQQQYERDNCDLVKLRSKAVSLKAVPKSETAALAERIRNIFHSAHVLAYKFFGQSALDRHVFTSNEWQKLGKDDRLTGIPLVPSDSGVANQMRVAGFLRLLASSALDHIFLPVYLTGDGTEVSDFILNLYDSNPQDAEWIRSILLNVEPETQAKNALKRAENVAEEVAASVDFLLQPASTRTEFRAALDQWCEESTQAWRDLQQCEFAFYCSFEPQIQEILPKEWTAMPELPSTRKGTKETNGGSPNGSDPTIGEGRRQDIVPSNVAAQVWPTFFATRNDGRTKVVRPGYVLNKQQVAAALEEVVPSRSQNRSHQRLRRQERTRQLMNLPNNSTDAFL